MDIISRGAFRVTSTIWQPRPGTFTLTLVCRAAFELAPGESPMVTLPPGSATDGPDRKLIEDAITAAPLKRWPEVLVTGHVHAPDGKPATTLTARLAVGDLDKAIQVQGDRWLTREGQMLGAAPFTRMPLRWDRAAGGPGTWNPKGMPVGADAPSDDRGRLALPSFEPAGVHVSSRSDVIPPVGLGPLAPESPMRAERLGRHAPGWSHAAWSARPLAEDFDFAYFNAAPHDQILAALAGDERIVLEHLHPRYARLTTYLRVVPPSASAGFGGAAHEIRLACDTLSIDTDRGIAELVWRGQLALDRPDREGMIMVIEDRAAGASSKPHTATAVLAEPRATSGAKSSVVTTMAPSAPARPVVPFQPQAPGMPVVLPQAPVVMPAPRNASVVMTMAPTPARAERPLPFAQTPVPAPRFGPPPDLPPVAPAPAIAALLTPRAESPSAPTFGAWPIVEARSDMAPTEPPPPIEPAAVPPEMLGPIPVVAVESKVLDDDVLPLDAYPIDRCARIAARLARRPEDAHAILDAEEVAEGRWSALHAHWLGAIKAESGRGKKALLSAYDDAYVAELEKERGPIDAAEYARLVVSVERGGAEPTLREMGLPLGAMTRIRRVWLARIVKDGKVAAGVRAAMREATAA